MLKITKTNDIYKKKNHMLKYQHIENKYEEIKNTGKKVTLKDQRQRQKSNCTVVDQRQSVNLSNNSRSS